MTEELKERAIEGDVEAQYELGMRYLLGRGEEEDYKKAAKWITKAAEQGHTHAEFNLGWMYYEGLGVTQNYDAADKWTKKAVGVR